MKYSIILLIGAFFVNCKSYFNCLPNNVIAPESISGTYENSALLSPFGTKNLWHCLNRRSKTVNDKHVVCLKVVKQTLYVQLIKGKEIIEEKRITGTLTDSCFIARKKYLFIPILPVLWFYDNQQIRISARDSSLLIDEYTENGSAVIIWAGGDNWKKTYEYRKITVKDTTNTSPNKYRKELTR